MKPPIQWPRGIRSAVCMTFDLDAETAWISRDLENLNRIIRSADYDSWLSYLSEQYIRTTSDPAYLREQSEKPLLRQADIRLHD